MHCTDAYSNTIRFITCIMSRVEGFRDTDSRSQLRELRTDIAMAVDDPFPLLYGLVDRNVITEQLFKVK